MYLGLTRGGFRDVTLRSHLWRDNASLPFPERAVTVHSEGDTWVMEQLGEKQDFEAELSRLGIRHEDFTLRVRRARPAEAGLWAYHYAVRVTNCQSAKSDIYWGGPGENWVAQFARDLAGGYFGQSPIVDRGAGAPQPGANR
jgi:hypothetical protein